MSEKELTVEEKIDILELINQEMARLLVGLSTGLADVSDILVELTARNANLTARIEILEGNTYIGHNILGQAGD